MSIRLLVADDESIVRAGVICLVTGSEIEVACQTSRCEETVWYATTCSPDVVLLDVRMDGDGGFGILEKIKKLRPETSVVMFSVSESLSDVVRAYQLGADGYVYKNASREELLGAIRRAAAGKPAWTVRQRRQVSRAGKYYSEATDGRSLLSAREIQVLQRITRGANNEQISEELQINVETVKHHIGSILAKIGLEDRTQAALWALRQGIAEPDLDPSGAA